MLTKRPRRPQRATAFCLCAIAPRIRPTCVANSGGRDTTRPHPTTAPHTRRTALRGLAALALSFALPVNADVASDDDALANYPALRVGRQIVLPRWMDPSSTPAEIEVPAGERPHFTPQVGDGRSLADEMRILLARTGVVGVITAFSLLGMAMSDRETDRVPLPEKYDPRLVARYFAIRADRVAARVAQLAVEAARLLVLHARHAVDERLGARTLTPRARVVRAARRSAERADALRGAVARLGPAFIKLAQAISMRPDIFGSEPARQLQALQDSVLAPFPVIDAVKLIRDELGARPQAIFDSFDIRPMAGSSLGTVFRASIDGRPVAVKVQRPGVAESIALDFYIIRSVVGFVQWLFNYRAELRVAVDDYASRMYEELDYRNEMRNMLRFKELYGDIGNVVIPRPYEMYTSKKVIIMEFVDGNKIIGKNFKIKHNELDVVETGIQFALTQLLDKGFLHADMHNGNMLRTASGDLAYIDFGIMCEIPDSVREAMVLALFYLIHGEYAMLAETCVGLALMPPDAVEDELPEFTAALAEAFTDVTGKACDVRSPVVCRFSMIGVAEKLLQLGGRFPFVFNASFLNSLRCLGMLEGLALNADPGFSVLNVVYPFIMKKILGGDAGTPYRIALERVLLSPKGFYNWDKLDGMLREMQRAEHGGAVRRNRRPFKRATEDPFDKLLLSSRGGFLRRQLMKEWSTQPVRLRQGRSSASGVFRRASVTGKVRAMCVFLPMLVMRAILVVLAALWRLFRALFPSRQAEEVKTNETMNSDL